MTGQVLAAQEVEVGDLVQTAYGWEEVKIIHHHFGYLTLFCDRGEVVLVDNWTTTLQVRKPL